MPDPVPWPATPPTPPGLATTTGANIKDLISMENQKRQRRETDNGGASEMDATMTDRTSPDRPQLDGTMERSGTMDADRMAGTLERTGKDASEASGDTASASM